MNNPYHAPTADLSQAGMDAQPYQPKVFSVHGRIGRVRYLAYSMIYSIVAVLVVSVMFGILAAISPDLIALAAFAYIPVVGLSMIPAIRRCNDLNKSGWWSLLSLIPLVNVGFLIWALFFPGDSGANDFGPPPDKNSSWLIVAIILPIFLVGILAAIAIPAYQAYVLKAKAASSMQMPAPAQTQE